MQKGKTCKSDPFLWARCRQQLLELLWVSWPLILSQMLEQAVYTLTTVYTGHLGQVQLDAMALGNTAANVAGLSITIGINTACDTLFSQVNGSKNRKYLGILLQKALVINVLICLPCGALFVNMDYIFSQLGQDPLISRSAGLYSMYIIPGLIASSLMMVLCKYLAHQNVVCPSMWILFLINLIHWGSLHVFIVVFKLDIIGAAVAFNISYISGFLLHAGYIYISRVYTATWSGWSVESLAEWGEFISLGLYGLLMTCLSWWSMEVYMVFAGMLGKVPLGAHYLCLQTSNIIETVAAGSGTAVNVRVGNLIGGGDHVTARIATVVGIVFGFVCASSISVTVFCVGYRLINIFTADGEVIEVAYTLVPLLSLYIFSDFMKTTFGAIIRGIGRQRFGAFVAFIGVYGIALPVGIYLAFYLSLGLKGIWVGIVLSELVRLIPFCVRVLLIDWEQETRLARIRTSTSKELMTEYCEDSQGLLDPDLHVYQDSGPARVRTNRRLVLSRALLFAFFLLIFFISIFIHIRLDITYWEPLLHDNNTSRPA